MTTLRAYYYMNTLWTYVSALNLPQESHVNNHPFVPLLDLLYHHFPRDLILFAVSKRKPIYITEALKQIGRCLICYADNRVYDLGLSICK